MKKSRMVLLFSACTCIVKLREDIPKKTAALLDFVQMRGVEGPAQIFGTLHLLDNESFLMSL